MSTPSVTSEPPRSPPPTGGHPPWHRCLPALRRTLADAAEAWVEASLRSKGWASIPHARAEEWASGPLPVARFVARLARGDRPGIGPRGRFVDGSRVHAVHSLGGGDSLLLFGHRAEVHEDPAAPLPTPTPAPGQCLVLGAGNVTATPLLDAIEQICCHGHRVVLKLSPLHEPLQPVFAQALQPLLATGALAFATGGPREAAALANAPAITAIHLTGSARTWGMLRGDANLRGKRLTGEVGCCTPAIVLPGPWLPGELRRLAQQLAAYVATNGGATCLAPRVLLTAAGWPQRGQLLTLLREELGRLPPRVPFHASVREHWQQATGTTAPAAALPPTLCADQRGDSARAACGEEWFAPVLREFTLPGNDFAAFAAAATDFVRTWCFGRLSAYVWAPANTRRHQPAVIDQLVAALPHGTIAINTWTGLAYGLGTTPWGVPPDAPIEAGSGFARNRTGRSIRRTVVRAGGIGFPPPPWLPAHRRAAATLRALTLHALHPTLPRFLRTALHALRP